VGFCLRCRQSRHAGLNSRNRGIRRAPGGTRERNLSRSVTETVMSQKLGATLAKKTGVSSEEQLAGFLQSILQGQGQTAAEIANAALFLCSNASSAMTGQPINVDGGAAFF